MKKGLLAATFIVYLLVVAGITIVPTRFSRGTAPHAEHINLVPLGYSFKCFLVTRRAHPDLTGFCVRNTLGNIALLLPFGILLPLNSGRFRSWQRVLALACLLSMSIETLQFLLRFAGSPRAVDIDDVILNTFGAGLGFVIWRFAAGGDQGEKGKRGNRGRGGKG